MPKTFPDTHRCAVKHLSVTIPTPTAVVPTAGGAARPPAARPVQVQAGLRTACQQSVDPHQRQPFPALLTLP
jgi:hypothetical protein